MSLKNVGQHYFERGPSRLEISFLLRLLLLSRLIGAKASDPNKTKNDKSDNNVLNNFCHGCDAIPWDQAKIAHSEASDGRVCLRRNQARWPTSISGG